MRENRDLRENRSSGSGWRFWLGLALGAAAGYYLNSEEGRRWGRDLNERARMELGNLSEKAGDALQRSKHVADRTRTNLKQKVSQLSSAAENALDRTEESYERAADWATNKLSNGSRSGELGEGGDRGTYNPGV